MIKPHDAQTILALIRKLLDPIIEKKCADCVSFDNGLCRLCKPPERIPEDVLPVGCPEWRFDESKPPF